MRNSPFGRRDRKAEFSPQAPIEHPEIVEPSAAIALGSPKQDHMVAQRLAHVAGARHPGACAQNLAVYATVIVPWVVEVLVALERRDDLIEAAAPSVV
jgi:hypothetical protein